MYPLFLKLENTLTLVIGGGTIAERKVIKLLEAGASVTLISPEITEGLQELINTNKIIHKKRLYKPGDTEKFFLIISATNSKEINKLVFKEAENCQKLINSVDDPQYCNFYVPALLKRGNLKIAVSTEGKLPLLAGKIRQYLESLFPENFGEDLEKLAKVRKRIIKRAGDDEKKKKRIFKNELIPSIENILKDIKR